MVKKTYNWLAKDSIDFFLVFLTVILFFGLGLIFFYSTFYSWLKTFEYQDWTSTFSYIQYITAMNIAAFGMTVVLIIVMLFCLERRVLSTIEGLVAALIAVISGIVGYILGGAVGGINTSMLIIFSFQFYLLIKLLFGQSIKSEKVNVLEKAGSIILHASYALLVMAIGGLNNHPLQLPVFWAAFTLSLVGTVLSFYGKTIWGFLRT